MSSIEQKVMASVRVIYFGRKLKSPTAFKLYGVSAGLVALRELTYLRQTIINMFDVTSVDGLLTFLSSAFLNTELAVQAALLATAVVAVLFLRDVISTRRVSTRFA